MGTNFYLISPEPLSLYHNPDFTDNRYHIGKRSYGWQFAFQAHTVGCYPGVASFADWIRIFETTPDARIEDEYGREYNVVEFCKDVVLPTKGKMGREEHLKEARLFPKETWEDEEGWMFCDYDFC
jgi:hypothetical protein